MYNLYTVIESERLDQLCNRLFGEWLGYVEAILSANPGLASEVAEDEALDVGRVLRIPQDAVGSELDVVRIWT